MYRNKVESIVWDTTLELRRTVSLDDFQDYVDNESFYNDINHEEKICTINELETAIKRMNKEYLESR